MKFKIKKEIILKNLNNVSKGVSSKNIIPILNGIKFSVSEINITMLATDNNITVQSIIDSSKVEVISETGVCVVQSKYLLEIIKKLPNEVITFEVIEDIKLQISTSNSTFNLNIYNVSDYPEVILTKSKTPLILKESDLIDMVNETLFATSNQESRPLLTGLNFSKKDQNLKVVATDSYRLAQKIIPFSENIEDFNIVIPNKNIIELLKTLNNPNKDIVIHIFNNKVLFEFDNILFQSVLLNGTYPDTSSLIPNSTLLSFNCDLNAFYDVIDRASLLTNDKDKNIVKLSIKGDNLMITSNSPEIGRVEERMVISKSTSIDIDIAFSSKYMKEALKSFTNNQIEICFNGEIKPIIIKSQKQTDLTQLILPIKTY